MAGDAREGFKLVKQTIEEVGDPHRTISAAADAVLLARGGNQRGVCFATTISPCNVRYDVARLILPILRIKNSDACTRRAPKIR